MLFKKRRSFKATSGRLKANRIQEIFNSRYCCRKKKDFRLRNIIISLKFVNVLDLKKF